MSEPTRAWHALAPDEVADALSVDIRSGLDPAEAAKRLESHGPNQLPEEAPEHPLLRFLKQFRNVLIYILLGAMVFTAVLGEWLDSGVILLVVVVNALVGFIQEGKAAEAMEGIRGLLSPTARVLRGGKVKEVDAADLVPGDVVTLESGGRVPADLRVVKSLNARVEEALLTGESEPVSKTTEPVAEDALPADRHSMAFSGTLVTSGRLTGIVTATGSDTEIGRIGTLVSRVEGVTTPLLRQIDQFGTRLSVIIVAASVAVFFLGWQLRQMDPADAFLAVVALAVAAIPEGLPAILTITLALGVQRMARQNAIIRRLPAVETLGSVSVICTDKTGTLTRNEMAAERLLLSERVVEVRGEGYQPEGTFHGEDGAEADPAADDVLQRLVRVAMLCNEASFSDDADGEGDAPGSGRSLQGDPTDGALLALGERAGMDPGAAAERWPQLGMVPFESERRWMATAHRDTGDAPDDTPDDTHGRRILLKGAPERVLDMCGKEATPDGGTADIDPGKWNRRMEEVAGLGYRLIALADAPGEEGADPETTGEALAAEVESVASAGGFTLLGVAALMDPPRGEAGDAVARCIDAGIRVLMITGDHAATARSIGARLGIGDGSRALEGAAIETASDDELAAALGDHSVVARAGPEHKLRIVKALQAGGDVCAMTGDGVNDAPALKQADIGVAMGIKGTEAARSASEMVLADDNFATIERAVEEGRTVYDNLKKTILFILPTNGAEALIVVAGVVLALGEFPITPVQILWVNMVTAVTLALALAFEPTEPGIMGLPPRDPSEPLLSRFLFRRIVYVSVFVSTGCLLVFQWELGRGSSPDYARTAVVNALVAAQLWYLFTCRFKWRASVGWDALTGNRAALVAAAVLILVQGAFTYLPPFHLLFSTEPLAAISWVPILGVGLALYVAVELEKAAGRSTGRGGAGAAEAANGAADGAPGEPSR
ncbi:MAG: HAD family hydrolase [Gemmatimonadales bacterium]|nr:MAG: HAD family hydrolase [Gemmatimonadales bacterium]